MRKIILVIVATGLFLCSVNVWASASRTADTYEAPTFVICNAL
jgi:hypothetical protein